MRRKRSRYARSEKLFEAASSILPGGVDSPVRAFRGVGGTPIFVAKARGARHSDVDGNTYIDYVMSWGPLIHGHAPKGLRKALAAAAAKGTSFGAPDRARDAAGRTRREADAIDRAGSLRQLRHRGRDERRARRPRGDRLRSHREIRRLLSRARRRVPRAGRIRRDDARRADEPRRAVSAPRVTPSSRATTTWHPSRPSSTRTAIRSRRSFVEPIAGNMGVVPPRQAFSRGCARSAIASTRSSSSTR